MNVHTKVFKTKKKWFEEKWITICNFGRVHFADVQCHKIDKRIRTSPNDLISNVVATPQNTVWKLTFVALCFIFIICTVLICTEVNRKMSKHLLCIHSMTSNDVLILLKYVEWTSVHNNKWTLGLPINARVMHLGLAWDYFQ